MGQLLPGVRGVLCSERKHTLSAEVSFNSYAKLFAVIEFETSCCRCDHALYQVGWNFTCVACANPMHVSMSSEGSYMTTGVPQALLL